MISCQWLHELHDYEIYTSKVIAVIYKKKGLL